ncbi:hypothetical protein [Flavobacterium sp.]|uniref:hypothetical protein n=1 Tax=Flavobacterium sp. TaxID=239 RepID=UPI0039E4DF65
MSQLTQTGEFSTRLAFLSFAFGTFLLLLVSISPDVAALYMVGFFYVLFCLFANGVVLVQLLYEFITMPSLRSYLAIKILILLANIPIVLLYLFLLVNHFFI